MINADCEDRTHLKLLLVAGAGRGGAPEEVPLGEVECRGCVRALLVVDLDVVGLGGGVVDVRLEPCSPPETVSVCVRERESQCVCVRERESVCV